MLLTTYIASFISIATYMSHFWYVSPVSTVLWIVSGASAIFCIYGGIISRANCENELRKAIYVAAAVVGGLVLLGLTLSAIFLFVPAMS